MPWFKVDDGLHSHPKWLGLSAGARALWVTTGSWCAAQLTDGHVPRNALSLFGGRPSHAAELVRFGLWDETGNGWTFHDWAQYQPTREQVLRERDIARRRQAMNADPELRRAIKARDGNTCRYCGRTVNWRDRKGAAGATYDHVIPIPAGGDESLDNLVVACRDCNTRKGSQTPLQAGMTVRPSPRHQERITPISSSDQDGITNTFERDHEPPDPTRPTKELSSSDALTTQPDTPTDDDHASAPDPRVEAALGVLAARDLDDRQRIPSLAPVQHVDAWTSTALADRRRRHGAQLTELAAIHPTLKAIQLAAMVDEPITAGPTVLDPVAQTQAAFVARVERERRRAGDAPPRDADRNLAGIAKAREAAHQITDQREDPTP